MAKKIKAKKILSKVKNDSWFGLLYNMNLYRGCQHACIYCDSRSVCYQLGELHDIRYKENALELLAKELKGKKQRGTIGFGSMNDPYMPIEKELQLTRKALEYVEYYKFPIHIITKSNLVVRDVDILKKTSKVYAAISITITTASDKLAKIIEPNAPLPSERFAAIKKLRKEGIYCGITLMPILPFINDTDDNIFQIVEKASTAGAKYIIPALTLTLREGSREYFYSKLDKHFPRIKQKYIKAYGNKYNCIPKDGDTLYRNLLSQMKKFGIPKKMNFYSEVAPTQMKLF